MIRILDAIRTLCTENHPNCQVHMEGDLDNIIDLSVLTLTDNTDQSAVSPSFTIEDVKDKQKSMQEEYDALDYSRQRQLDYPSIPDQLDEIYHNGLAAWKAVIKVTKDKYKKG